jgi:hypothetical protein
VVQEPVDHDQERALVVVRRELVEVVREEGGGQPETDRGERSAGPESPRGVTGTSRLLGWG